MHDHFHLLCCTIYPTLVFGKYLGNSILKYLCFRLSGFASKEYAVNFQKTIYLPSCSKDIGIYIEVKCHYEYKLNAKISDGMQKSVCTGLSFLTIEYSIAVIIIMSVILTLCYRTRLSLPARMYVPMHDKSYHAWFKKKKKKIVYQSDTGFSFLNI